MKLWDKYLLKEQVLPFLGGLFFLTVVLLLDRIFDLLELIIVKGLSVRTVLELLFLSLPFILAMSFPMANLVTSLLVLGRLAEERGLLALHTLGIPMRRSLRPLFYGGAILMTFLVAFNNTVLPEANHRLKNLLIDIQEKRPIAQIQEGVFTGIENFNVFVGRKNDKTSEIYGVTIQENLEDGRVRTILAERGRFYRDREAGLFFELQEGEIHEASGPEKEFYRRTEFKTHRVLIPLKEELIRKERGSRGDREMSARMLFLEIRNLEEKRTERGERSPGRREYQLWVEFHKKFSLPSASLVFTFLGGVIGLLVRRGGYGTAFGIGFLVFTIYYIFLIGGEDLADRALLSPGLAMWLPNAFFTALGFLVLRRVERGIL